MHSALKKLYVNSKRNYLLYKLQTRSLLTSSYFLALFFLLGIDRKPAHGWQCLSARGTLELHLHPLDQAPLVKAVHARCLHIPSALDRLNDNAIWIHILWFEAELAQANDTCLILDTYGACLIVFFTGSFLH